MNHSDELMLWLDVHTHFSKFPLNVKCFLFLLSVLYKAFQNVQESMSLYHSTAMGQVSRDPTLILGNNLLEVLSKAE